VSRILVVDDEPSICWGLSRLARTMGLRVDTASSAEHGLTLASAARPDVLVLDVRLPGVDGLTAMESFRRHMGDAPIIVMTAFGDLSTAVSAVAKGAFEYIVKPFDLPEIRAALERALSGGVAPTDGPRRPETAVDGMLGATPIMHAVFKRIALAAASDAAVLLSGEGGVGKALAARAIHRHSARRDAPFVAVNFAGMAPMHAEAELFGYVKLPSAGSREVRSGLLAQANGGTLYLDEPAEIPLPLQVKLLRALDQGEATPVGGAEPVKTSFRLISATQSDLREAVNAGAFRQDLYLRLTTFSITLPPLRERCADIPLLALHFAAETGGGAVLSAELLAELQRRPWHGNVRELRNAIEHALVVARSGAALPRHLPEPMPLVVPPASETGSQPAGLEHAVAALANTLLENPENSGGVYDLFLGEVEPPLLATALSRHGNRCAPAARALGLHRTSLKRKLDQYGIDEEPPEV
jgi:two-component system nitrogen regulation response regulator GlnG